MELRTGLFRELVEALLGQDLVDRLIVRVALRTKLLVRDEQVLLLAIPGAHCHAVFVHHRRSAVDLDQVFRSLPKHQTRPSASGAHSGLSPRAARMVSPDGPSSPSPAP